jgi:hypothetical protein
MIMQANNILSERSVLLSAECLKDTCSTLTKHPPKLKLHSKSYEDLRRNISSVQEDIDNYKKNIEEIKKLRSELTGEINAWYGFIKNTTEIKKLSFPLKFLIKRKMLKNSLKRVNDSIAKITIENRFIKENLAIWEHKLEHECIEEIKDGLSYSNYDLLAKKKSALIDELKYILPTIPGICPIEVEIEKIDRLIEELKKLEHAA